MWIKKKPKRKINHHLNGQLSSHDWPFVLMTDYDDLYGWQDTDDQPSDVYEKDARAHLKPFFEQHRDRVFFSRQLEVQNEDRYFHWITNRAIRDLEGEGRSGVRYARCQFVTQGREMNSFGGQIWNETEHDLDFIFERDGIAYGVEVKNTLGYMNYEEFRIKIRLCGHLGLRPVSALMDARVNYCRRIRANS